MAKEGIVYLAMGPAYAVLAGLSIKTLKKFSDIPVTVIVDDSVKPHSQSLGADTITCISNVASENRAVKSRIYELSPYENTLFIDCDTIINGDVADCFRYLEYFDIAIKQKIKAFSRLGKGSLSLFNGKHIVAELPHWNSGVIAFKRNKKTKNMFQDWAQLQSELKYDFDQPALAEAIIKSDVRVVSLEETWNFQNCRAVYGSKEKIIHYSSSLNNKIKRLLRETCRNNFPEFNDELEEFIISKLKFRKQKDGLKKYYKRRIRWQLDDILFSK